MGRCRWWIVAALMATVLVTAAGLVLYPMEEEQTFDFLKGHSPMQIYRRRSSDPVITEIYYSFKTDPEAFMTAARIELWDKGWSDPGVAFEKPRDPATGISLKVVLLDNVRSSRSSGPSPKFIDQKGWVSIAVLIDDDLDESLWEGITRRLGP